MYLNYRDAIKGLAGQGYQAFYKGNFVSVCHWFLFYGVNCQVNAFTGIAQLDPSPFQVYAATFTMSLCETFLQPIRVCQTRFIL